jgi:hypothetical protein
LQNKEEQNREKGLGWSWDVAYYLASRRKADTPGLEDLAEANVWIWGVEKKVGELNRLA